MRNVGHTSQSPMQPNQRQKRVALVISHLGAGGAQRVVANASNAFVKRGIDVHVITLLDGPTDAFELDSRVTRHRRGSNKNIVRKAAAPALRAVSNLTRR